MADHVIDRTPERKDEEVLEELRERYDYATAEWQDIREEGRTDMRYVSGDPWDPKAKKAREGRPCLVLDELQQYFNQTINDVRVNPLGIKFSPRGTGGDDRGARFYQDKTREIEYRSKASLAYVTAFENAVQRSYGFLRLLTKYAGDRTFDQDVWIQACPNPDNILPDPDAQRPDGIDQQYCFVEEDWDYRRFKRTFPKAQLKGFSGEFHKQAPSWVREHSVRVAEYWTIDYEQRTLLLFGDRQAPTVAFEDELRERPKAILDQRVVDIPRVHQYWTNGVELLTRPGQAKRTLWPGKYIPIVWCLGKVLYVDEGAGARRVILSMTRLARDPYMLYCYYRSRESELVGLSPLVPYFAAKGTLDTVNKQALADSPYKAIPVVEYEPVVDTAPGVVLPPPQQIRWEPPIQALEVGAEGARRAIQAAMGVSPMPTIAQRHNQKSGRALEQIEATEQKGSFHFVDHYRDMVEATGVLVEDLMDKVYDSARDVGVRKADDTAEIVRINDPHAEDPIDTKGEYAVTVSAGPSFESERREAADFAESLMQIPAAAARVMDLIVKLRNLGPIGDQIAERLTPPEFRQAGKDGKPDAGQLARSLAEAQQQLQQLQQAAAQMQQQLALETAKQNSQIRIAQIKAQSDKETAIELQRMKDASAIAVAKINALAKGVAIDQQAEDEAIALAQAHAHEAMENELDRQHEVGMATLGHQQSLDQAAAGVQGQMALAAAQPQEGAASTPS